MLNIVGTIRYRKLTNRKRWNKLCRQRFDSGWLNVQGLAPDDFSNKRSKNLWRKRKYSDPEFVSEQPIGPTALKFLHSDKLGKQYQNTIFTGDVDSGSIILN